MPVDDIIANVSHASNTISEHYNDVIISAVASQITSLTIVYLIVHSGANQRNHQSAASLAFVWGSHRLPVNSPHKMLPFDDVIMKFDNDQGRNY